MDIHFDKSNLEDFIVYMKTGKKPKDFGDYPFPDTIQAVIGKIILDRTKDMEEAVSTLDINNLKAVVDKWNKIGIYPDCFVLPSDEVLEINIRKMAVNMRNIPDKVKEEAKEWLLSRGYGLELE